MTLLSTYKKTIDGHLYTFERIRENRYIGGKFAGYDIVEIKLNESWQVCGRKTLRQVKVKKPVVINPTKQH